MIGRAQERDSCKRGVGNGGDVDGRRKILKTVSIGSVDVNPEDLENRTARRKQGGKHKVQYPGLK